MQNTYLAFLWVQPNIENRDSLQMWKIAVIQLTKLGIGSAAYLYYLQRGGAPLTTRFLLTDEYFDMQVGQIAQLTYRDMQSSSRSTFRWK